MWRHWIHWCCLSYLTELYVMCAIFPCSSRIQVSYYFHRCMKGVMYFLWLTLILKISVSREQSTHWKYRTRVNRPSTVYLLNQFFGPEFEISDCKNTYKTSANDNETYSISFSCANSSKNNIKAWIVQQRSSISLIIFRGWLTQEGGHFARLRYML